MQSCGSKAVCSGQTLFLLTFGGRSTWTPHIGLCLAQPRVQLAGGGAVAEAGGEGCRGGRPGERALNRESEGPGAVLCHKLAVFGQVTAHWWAPDQLDRSPRLSVTHPLPQVVLDSPGSSARTGPVCPRRWMRPWPAASTSQAQLPDPGLRNPSPRGATVSATVHAVTVTVAEAAARTPTGNPVQPGLPGSPVRRAAWAPTTMTTTWTGLCLPPASPSKVFTSSHEVGVSAILVAALAGSSPMSLLPVG